MISAEETRKISDEINKNADKNEIKLIEERIKKACEEGDYEITIYHDDGQLNTFLRDNTERILTELGYKMRNEHAFTFGTEYDLIISWENDNYEM